MPGPIAEVRQVVEAFADCWNKHDIDGFAQLFAQDAEFVNVVGMWWKGRDEIRRAHEFAHATMFRNSHLAIETVTVRFPSESIAIARARWLLEGHVSSDGAPLPPRNGILLNVVSSGPGAGRSSIRRTRTS